MLQLMFDCQYCEEPIGEGEPFEMVNGGAAALHRDCMIRMVVGSVGHQRRQCSCFGGTQEDPVGASRREAAKAAAREYGIRLAGGQPPWRQP
jgi:hypothetical protein